MEQAAERRRARERRLCDEELPLGSVDRRCLTERRIPRLAQNLISDAEWRQLRGEFRPAH